MQVTMWDSSGGNIMRWLRFNSVGAMGIGVQLAALTLFAGLLRMDYLVSTALAVEAAVIHNFVWHEFWTWADRQSGGGRGLIRRMTRFHVTNGIISIGGNLVLMRLLVGELRLHFLVANLITIAACSTLNFLASDRLVFQPSLWEAGTRRIR